MPHTTTDYTQMPSFSEEVIAHRRHFVSLDEVRDVLKDPALEDHCLPLLDQSDLRRFSLDAMVDERTLANHVHALVPPILFLTNHRYDAFGYVVRYDSSQDPQSPRYLLAILRMIPRLSDARRAYPTPSLYRGAGPDEPASL